MIDWARLRQLRSDVGEDAFDEVVELFLEEVQDGVDQLQAATDGGTLADQLHFLKGSAMNLGFRQFADLCQAGERRILSQGDGAVDLVALRDCFHRSRLRFLEDLQGFLKAA